MVKVPLYDQYEWKVVSDEWRKRAFPKKGKLGKRPRSNNSPLVAALLEGKTILTEYTIPFPNRSKIPYHTLYDYFSVRGYDLHICTVDDVGRNKYRKVLMWITPVESNVA